MAKRSPAVDEFDLSLQGTPLIKPRNASQSTYLSALKKGDVVFGLGPAGTGKTYLAAAFAIEQLALKRVSRIILTRATVPIAGERIGFLPGTMEKKMDPWVAEIFDIFRGHLGAERVKSMLSEGKIVIVPFAFMRGRTFKDSIVLADEIQNATPSQAKALVTRIGENTRLFINGDLGQSDLLERNGLEELVQLVKRFNLPFPVVEFTSRDVERSAVCRLWVEAYEKRDGA